MVQTSVEIVKPGGTGRPALVISARPEPLPPSRSFIVRLPSALPLPKKNTCFFDADRAALDLEVERRCVAAAVLAISGDSLAWESWFETWSGIVVGFGLSPLRRRVRLRA